MKTKNILYTTTRQLMQQLQIDLKTAIEIKQVIKEDTYDNLIVKYPIAQKRYNECYFAPTIEDIKLNIINELLNCHGIEHLNELKLDYINAGDIYINTVFYDYYNDKFFVSDLETIFINK